MRQRLLSIGALMLLVAGCRGNGGGGTTCANDAECTVPGTRCDVVNKTCICKTNEACPEGEFCNLAGACQALEGCRQNSDCASNTFCNVDTGACLKSPSQQLGSSCGLVSHCPFGTICKDGACQQGCYDDGDCVLGQICMDGQCFTGEGICREDNFCAYQEFCSDGRCKRDRTGPYCRGCSFRTDTNPEPCDKPRNFCLVNSLETGGHPHYCGVDCSLGQKCPNGYACDGVLILTESVCTFNAQCRCDPSMIRFATATCTVAVACDPRLPDGSRDPNATACVAKNEATCNQGGTGDASCIVPIGERVGKCTCTVDAECSGGGKCVDGVCCTGPINNDRSCAVDEGDVSGFCTCAHDDDCPRDSCDLLRGACAITGRKCTAGGNECGAIPCIDGACLIGQNCAPIAGLSCSVLTAGE